MGARPNLKLPLGESVMILLVFILKSSINAEKIEMNTNETEACLWIKKNNRDLAKYTFEYMEVYWNYMTNVTKENSAIEGAKYGVYESFKKNMTSEAKKFDWKNFKDQKLKRIFANMFDMDLSKVPENNTSRKSGLKYNMGKIYNTAKLCNKSDESANHTEMCYVIDPDLNKIMASSNDSELLTWAWEGWRNVSGKQMLEKYEEYVQLNNEAARLNGYQDFGDYWRSKYESPSFREDCEALWLEIKPFYKHLHAYVRRKLMEKYPKVKFPKEGHIPAHLLGDMWAQQWRNIKSLLKPVPTAQAIDITEELVKQNYTALKLYQMSDKFFQSLGLIPMSESFWNKSMIEKPVGREVLCQASAWDFYNGKDFRIKQCTNLTSHHFMITHHEMGHVQYFMQYRKQSYQFKGGANPGFHEAIGDLIYLSVVTPEHLKSVGLLHDYNNSPESDLNFLMNEALKTIAFLPYSYLIDQWRWDVFAKNVSRSKYNFMWWRDRCKYQGLYPPVKRSETDFDPGAKFHIASNIPYIRYFVSHIIQYQFHFALCKAAKYTGPLHRCNIENSTIAGRRLANLMKIGASQQWQIPFKKLTGTTNMSAKPLMNYFKPLYDWLKKQNKGKCIGWKEDCPSGSFE